MVIVKKVTTRPGNSRRRATTVTTIRRRTRRARVRNSRATAVVPSSPPPDMLEYLNTVFGPLGTVPSLSGIPDGSSLKSIVVTHKQTISITPYNNTIAAAIVPSPIGGIAVATGITGPFATFSAVPTTGQSGMGVEFLGVAMDGTRNYGIIPAREWLSATNVYEMTSGPINPSAFRIITQRAKISYTGAPLYAQGAMSVGRQVVATDGPVAGKLTVVQGGVTNNTSTSQYLQMSSAGPIGVANTANLPGAVTIPVSATLRSPMVYNIPYGTQYCQWIDGLVPGIPSPPKLQNEALDGTAAWYTIAHVSGDQTWKKWWTAPAPGIGNAPTTFISATGLQQGGEIVLTVETVVEYALDFASAMLSAASPSPSVDQRALNVVADVSKHVPALVPSGSDWFKRGLRWYANTWFNIYKTTTGGIAKALVGVNPWQDFSGFAGTISRGLVRSLGQKSLTYY